MDQASRADSDAGAAAPTSRRRCTLVGIAGSANTYSLSLYNLKAYSLADAQLQQAWDIRVIQSGLISEHVVSRALPALVRQILEGRPELIGVSCYVWNVAVMRQLLDEVRAHLPDVKIVWGGPEITADYIRDSRFDAYPMDYAAVGEGERTFFELLQHLSGEGPPIGAIDGLCHRRADGGFEINAPRRPFASLAELPSAVLSGVIEPEMYLRPDLEANIETQRGCSLRCSYCVYHKDMSRISYNDVERVMSEVTALAARGVRKLRFNDANFTSNLEFAKALFTRLVEAEVRMGIMFELVPGFLDEEFCGLVQAYQSIGAGNRVTVGVGVQTINHDVLKRIRRGIRLATFERTFELLQKHGIYAKIDLIIGLPGEDAPSIEATMEYMINRLRGSADHLLCFHLMRELPGTELIHIAKDFDMRFASEEQGHELLESPLLPRQELIRLLRQTALIFRLVNQSGWAGREFLGGREDDDTSVRDRFFECRDRLGLGSLELVQLLIGELTPHLARRNSRFVRPDFPSAEAWWWNNARFEISNAWIHAALDRLEMAGSRGLPASQVAAP